jgi:hypothetical protein
MKTVSVVHVYVGETLVEVCLFKDRSLISGLDALLSSLIEKFGSSGHIEETEVEVFDTEYSGLPSDLVIWDMTNGSRRFYEKSSGRVWVEPGLCLPLS